MFKKPLHNLVQKLGRGLDTDEYGGVRRESTKHGRTKALEQSSNSVRGNRLTSTVHKAAVRALWRALEARLDHIRRNGHRPHGHTSETTSSDCRGNVELRCVAARSEHALDELVGSKVAESVEHTGQRTQRCPDRHEQGYRRYHGRWSGDRPPCTADERHPSDHCTWGRCRSGPAAGEAP